MKEITQITARAVMGLCPFVYLSAYSSAKDSDKFAAGLIAWPPPDLPPVFSEDVYHDAHHPIISGARRQFSATAFSLESTRGTPRVSGAVALNISFREDYAIDPDFRRIDATPDF